MLVGHGVERAEYLALVGAVGGLVLAYNDDGSYDEEEEEGEVAGLTDSFHCSFSCVV